MTQDELAELMDLDLDGLLPDALRARLDTHLAADPAAARDAATLRDAVAALRTLPAERPASWFVERCLDGLLHDNARAEHQNLQIRTR